MTPKDLPELPEPDAHMYPSDLEKFRTRETWAQAFSVAVGNPDERSEPLFAEAKMNAHAAAAYDLGARSPRGLELTEDRIASIAAELEVLDPHDRVWVEFARAVESELGARSTAPIDMVLHCPNCGKQHIDTPEPGHRILYADEPIREQSHGTLPGWDNPPHRTHLCHGCGHKWRPADVPTNGVAAVKTKGKADSPFASVTIASATHADAQKLRAALLEVGKWEHRGDSIAEGWDEKYGNGAWAALFEGARSTAAQPVEPTARFDDARVQIVYELLCDGREVPPPIQDWAGLVARRTVDALFAVSRDSRSPAEAALWGWTRQWRECAETICTIVGSEVVVGSPSDLIAGVRSALAASGDSTPPSEPAVEVVTCLRCGHANLIQEGKAMAQVQGDPSGAPRPEPEAVGQGRWWRKRPVVVEAFQWDGTEAGCQAAKARFPELETSSKSGHLRRPEVTSWHIRTLEGHMRVSPGDWIVRGVAGEFYPCKPDIFAATYEPAEPPQAASGERGD